MNNEKGENSEDEDRNKENEMKGGDEDEEKSLDNDATYQHVKNAKSTDRITLDDANEEQQQMQHNPEVENGEDENTDDKGYIEGFNTMEEEDEIFSEPEDNLSAESFDKKRSETLSIKEFRKLPQEQDNGIQEHIEIDGEIVNTSSVKRNDDSVAFCR